MKLFQWSLVLSLFSYGTGGFLRRFWLSPGEASAGIQGFAVILLLILPAGIGVVLAMTSLKRKEANAGWAIIAIVLNIAMALAGLLLLFPA